MTLSQKDIIHLAHLARISLSEEELVAFEQELPSILQFVAELNSAPTDAVEPMTGGTDLVNVMRDDAIISPLGDPVELRAAFMATDARGSAIVPQVFSSHYNSPDGDLE